MNRTLICLAVVAGIGATAAMAEDLYVKVPFVYVRQGKGAIYPIVATVKKPGLLSAQGHEGVWVKVQTSDEKQNTVQGYVAEVALQADKPDAGDFKGTSLASQVTVGDAPKGLGPEVKAYSKNKKQSSKALEDLMKFRSKIKFEDIQAFDAEGKVGIGQTH